MDGIGLSAEPAMRRESERQENEGWARNGVGWVRGMDDINSSERPARIGEILYKGDEPTSVLRVQLQRKIHIQEHRLISTISIY